jgi:hypothetical protein
MEKLARRQRRKDEKQSAQDTSSPDLEMPQQSVDSPHE